MGGNPDGIGNPLGNPAGGIGKDGNAGVVLALGLLPASRSGFLPALVSLGVVFVAGVGCVVFVGGNEASGGASTRGEAGVGSAGSGIGSSFFEQPVKQSAPRHVQAITRVIIVERSMGLLW